MGIAEYVHVESEREACSFCLLAGSRGEGGSPYSEKPEKLRHLLHHQLSYL